jgi:hypothetical protein
MLTATFMRLARRGDVEAFRAFVSSEGFIRAFTGLDPKQRQSAMCCYGKAQELCEAKARYPLVRPKPIDAQRIRKADWRDPAMRARLANAYAVAGGDHEKAARILGVSLGSARLAKKRYLDAAAIDRRQKAS